MESNENKKSEQSSYFGVPAKTLGLVILLAFTAVLLVYYALSPQKIPTNNVSKVSNEAVEDTTLSIKERNKHLSGNYSYSVFIDTGKNNVTAVQLELSFDPKVLTNVEITPSDFFTNPIELLNNIDTKTGRISYALSIPAQNSGVLGSGSLATISFNKLPTRQAQTEIKFLPKTEVSAQETSVSVLKQTQDGIVLFATPTASPFPKSKNL